jgi:hypothetical protein
MHSVSTISDNTSSKRILQGPFLVDADLRCRFGLSTMVSNALGCLRCCTVHSLGRCCGTLLVSRMFVCQRTVANLSFRGTCLWLWLGVLDAVQGVGLYVDPDLASALNLTFPSFRGMILLQTLSRLHVCATLAIAQMLGSVVVIIARATAPNRVSPSTSGIPNTR